MNISSVVQHLVCSKSSKISWYAFLHAPDSALRWIRTYSLFPKCSSKMSTPLQTPQARLQMHLDGSRTASPSRAPSLSSPESSLQTPCLLRTCSARQGLVAWSYSVIRFRRASVSKLSAWLSLYAATYYVLSPLYTYEKTLRQTWSTHDLYRCKVCSKTLRPLASFQRLSL